jgi:hypothetical protein
VAPWLRSNTRTGTAGKTIMVMDMVLTVTIIMRMTMVPTTVTIMTAPRRVPTRPS